MRIAHAFSSAEYALAREGAHVGRAFASAGLDFDPATFVALRIIESLAGEHIDPVAMLGTDEVRGMIVRSVDMTDDLLADVG